jgi:hypothetical protein
METPLSAIRNLRLASTCWQFFTSLTGVVTGGARQPESYIRLIYRGVGRFEFRSVNLNVGLRQQISLRVFSEVS